MQAERVAEAYYDSSDADAFYFQVWGGEDIHIGIYERPDEPIADASHRSVERLAERLDLKKGDHVLDLGAGYGGAARHLARRYGCRVTCLNLSEVQNERNRRLTEKQGLTEQVTVVQGSFESLPFRDRSFDHLWSQDSFLHAGDKRRVFEEARRVLRPGGKLVFTDPMQADDAPDEALGPVLDRIHLDHMGSFGLYRSIAESLQLGFSSIDLSGHLPVHYGRVREELLRRRAELEAAASPAYLDRMVAGLGHWVDAGGAGHLAWGILEMAKPN